MRSRSGLAHRPSPAKQKYSRPRQVLPGLGHHRLAPVVEVLDAPDLHAWRVDVDPVVRKQVVALQDQRDDQEVAIAQPLGGRIAPGVGAAGSSALHQRAQRRVEITWSA